MPFTAIHTLLVILIVQTLLLAIFLLTTGRGKRVSNRLLAALLLAFTTLFAVTLAKDHGLAQQAAGLDLIAAFALGPLIELQARSLMTSGFRLRRGQLLLFMPVLIGLAAAFGRLPPWLPAQPLLFLSLAIFITRALVAQRAYRAELVRIHASINAISLDWLRVSLWLMAVVVALGALQHYSEQLAPAAVADYLTAATLLAFAAFLIVFMLKALNHPGLFDGVEPQALSRPRASVSDTIPAEQLVGVQQALRACMSERQLFLRSSLQLADLARESRIAESTISEAIRRGLADNFFDFVNGYRVETARALLAETDQSISQVMLASGFNSKSSFYTEFQRRTGLPPGLYRRRSGGH